MTHPTRSEARAVVWVVAGAPGAGKSTVAEELRHRLRPSPALIDKDTIFAGFVDEVRRAHGRPTGEREGPWYDRHVKVHEYAGMTAAAAQIRASGCPVLLVAPFTSQIRDMDEWERWVRALGGDPVRLVWVSIDPPSLRSRLVRRGSPLDTGKLDAWDAFVTRVMPDRPPSVPHERIDNGGTVQSLVAQVESIAATAQPSPTWTSPLS